jgi:hypothetical protein
MKQRIRRNCGDRDDTNFQEEDEDFPDPKPTVMKG